MYSLGKEQVPLFAVCGQMWELLNDDGNHVGTLSGSKDDCQLCVDKINSDLYGRYEQGRKDGYMIGTKEYNK